MSIVSFIVPVAGRKHHILHELPANHCHCIVLLLLCWKVFRHFNWLHRQTASGVGSQRSGPQHNNSAAVPRLSCFWACCVFPMEPLHLRRPSNIEVHVRKLLATIDGHTSDGTQTKKYMFFHKATWKPFLQNFHRNLWRKSICGIQCTIEQYKFQHTPCLLLVEFLQVRVF